MKDNRKAYQVLFWKNDGNSLRKIMKLIPLIILLIGQKENG